MLVDLQQCCRVCSEQPLLLYTALHYAYASLFYFLYASLALLMPLA
jgi:hypothetical protein